MYKSFLKILNFICIILENLIHLFYIYIHLSKIYLNYRCHRSWQQSYNTCTCSWIYIYMYLSMPLTTTFINYSIYTCTCILCYKGYQWLAAGDGVPALKIKITNNKQDKLFNYIQGTCKFNSQYSWWLT